MTCLLHHQAPHLTCHPHEVHARREAAHVECAAAVGELDSLQGAAEGIDKLDGRTGSTADLYCFGCRAGAPLAAGGSVSGEFE